MTKEKKSVLGQITHTLRNKDEEIESDHLVGISIKVPERLRKKWKIRAAEEGITITEAIIEALNERFNISR